MYYRGKTDNISPFEIECSNCRSHDVDVRTLRRNQFQIKCNKCESCLNTDSYNELTFRDYKNNQNIGCGLFVMAMAVIVAAVIVMMV